MGLLIFVIAGEPSGDLLGARLMAGLSALTGGAVSFAGIGGEMMEGEGLISIFPMAELSVMGLVEVLPRIPRILRRLEQTLGEIERLQPDAVVTIDSWGFSGRIQQRLKRRMPSIPRIHYVAPMVWAWKPERTKKLAAVLDLLMTLLPFEPKWFIKDGLRTVHVGHPVIETGANCGNGDAFRKRYDIPFGVPILVALPGSRRSETSALLPVFGQTVFLLSKRFPEMIVIVPTVSAVSEAVRSAVASWPVRTVIVSGQKERYDSFAAGTVALAASGTVALELAMAGLPTVITYRMSGVTAAVARHLFGFKVKYATLVNIIMDRRVMPEFLQENCRVDFLFDEISRLLIDPIARSNQVLLCNEALVRLGLGCQKPSERAASTIIEYLETDREHKLL